ncbi:MAG: hypothetical protein ACHQ49_07850 [Elusimicrobiota bacterium]
MQKVRNAVIIIILCIIGGYKASRPAAPLHVTAPTDVYHDAIAGHPINTGLHLSNGDDDGLHDSVAGNAIPGFQPGFQPNNGQHGNTFEGTPPPPRGGGNGGIGTLGSNNPASNLPPTAPLSPSGPK